MSLRRIGLWCGILSPVLWLGLIVITGAMRPGFSHATQFISELGERGSATELLMRGLGFGFTGLLYLGFAAAAAATFRRGWLIVIACLLIALDGTGRMGAGVFPCDPGCVRVSPTQDLHQMFATMGFLSAVVAAIVWGVVVRRVSSLRSFSWPSVAAGVAAFVALLLMSWDGNPLHYPGLFEHAATTILSIWMLVFAIRVMSVEDQWT